MSTSIWNDFIETKQKKGDPGEFIFYEYMLSLYPDTSTHLFYFNDDGRYDLLHHNLDTHMSIGHSEPPQICNSDTQSC